MVTAGVGLEGHPVAVLVNLNVTLPADTPVTTPAFVTVAIAVLLLVHVPPVVGDKVVVVPTQILELPVIEAVGFALMVTAGVLFDTHPAVLVKVNVTVPAATPVTTPVFVTVAIAVLLLTHVPPVAGAKVVVASTHIDVVPVILAIGIALTDIGVLGLEIHPDAVVVKIKVADPAVTPVTTPPLVTVATALLLLVQVPPVFGDNVVVEPMHIAVFPVTLAIDELLMVTGLLGFDSQPVALFVKVNVAVPAATPVTTPLLDIVATALLLLVQVPPVAGDKVVVEPTHIALLPEIVATGLSLIVTGKVELDTQPFVLSVNVNVALPAIKPVTIPSLVTEAIDGLLLIHDPPILGESVVVLPAQIVLLPDMRPIGLLITMTDDVGLDTQPSVLVKINMALPAETPVTNPLFDTLATFKLLLAHVPPLLGDNVVVPPSQTALLPVIETVGTVFTVI
jgi:hypothetical protein